MKLTTKLLKEIVEQQITEMEQYSGPPSLENPAQESGNYFLVDEETGEKVKISLKMLEKLNKMGLARQDEFDSGDSLVFI
jgi:hypothetical protein